MPKQNLSDRNLPDSVRRALTTLGQNIALARQRRGLRQVDLAKKANVAAMTLVRVEQGHPTTSIAAYFAALWAMGLEKEITSLAAPERDVEGITLENAHRRQRVGVLKRGLDNDF